MQDQSWVSTTNMRATLQAELDIVSAALDEFDVKSV